jgi:hypothetical protein
MGQILAFAACDLRDRSQHDDRRDGKLDGKRRQTEGAAGSAGCGGQDLVKAL